MQKVTHKIIYLSDDFPPKNLGGAGMIAYEEARALRELGYEILVITTSPLKEDEGEKIIDDLRIITIYSNYHPRFRAYRSINNHRVVSRIDKILKKEKPDVIHAHNIHTHISYKTLKIAKKYTEKLFLTAHDVMLVHYGKFVPRGGDLKINLWKNLKEQKFRFNPLRNMYIRRYLKYVTAIFAVSNALKKVLEANGIERVHLLHNGIDERRWRNINQEEKQKFEREYGLTGKKIVLFAGRISGLKGGRVMKRVIKKIATRVPEARLLVAGKRIGEEDGDEYIIYTEAIPRDSMKYAYAVSEVIVTPSLYLDPFPTVNLEAMASHKPVVGTCFGGTPEAILDGQTGYILNPNAEAELKVKLVELLTHPEKARQFGEAGFKRFTDLFSIEIHMKKLLLWYNAESNGQS